MCFVGSLNGNLWNLEEIEERVSEAWGCSSLFLKIPVLFIIPFARDSGLVVV